MTLKIWLLPLLLQFAFYYQICGFWDPDSHYFYGWGIPFLGLFLFWTRSEDEPPRMPPALGWLLPAFVCFLAFGFLRVLWETMSSWHMLSWTQGLSLALFIIFWGIAWGGPRWTKHYLFPMLFFLASIPWPGRLELAISDWLTNHIATFVTFSLQMLGIPAVLQGIQISIGDSIVEVAEACSGIRSLQFLLVTTLFLGEYGQFGLKRRLALIAAGMCAAVVQNGVRALTLGWITGIEGQEAYERWHDNTGAITFVIGLGLVLIAFLIIEPKRQNKPAAKKADPAPLIATRPLALTSIVLLLLYGGAEAFRSSWYALPDDQLAQSWKLDEDRISRSPAFRNLEVDPLVTENYETEDVQVGRLLLGNCWIEYYFISWSEGYPVMRANAHTPEVCMGSVRGLIATKERSVHRLDAPWNDIEYESYEFKDPISAERISVFRSFLLPVSTQNYDQFYEQAAGGWGDKWKMAWSNFWERIDENSMTTRQLLFIGVTSPDGDIDQDTLYQFIDRFLDKNDEA